MKKYLKPLIYIYTVLLITLAYVPCTQAVMPSGRGHITQANVNEPHVRGLIPLHQAAQEGDMTTIHFLINQLGANIEAQCSSGRTALHWAAQAAQLEAVQELLRVGANINAQDNQGATALHWAMERGNADVIQTLIQSGINIEAQNSSGHTAVYWAVKWHQIDALKALIQAGAQLQSTDPHVHTPLHLAASGVNLEMVQTLIEAGSPMEAKDHQGKTALLCALLSGQILALKALLEAKADVYAKDNEGNTALHLAAPDSYSENFLEAIEALKRVGFGMLCSTNNAGHTPFMVGLKNRLFVKELLPDARIDSILENGFTQLGMAAMQGDLEMVEMIIAHGANIHAQDIHGHTAKDCAQLKGQDAVVAFLSAPDNNLLLRSAASNGEIELVKKYLEAGVQINYLDSQRHQAIYYAAKQKQLDTVAYLIEQGADLKHLYIKNSGIIDDLLRKYDPRYLELFKQLVAPQLKNYEEDTPLHQLVRYVDVAFIKFLIKQGINPNQKNTDGKTALHLAVKNADTEVFQYLISKNKKIRSKADYSGETVVHKAARKGSARILELCLEYQLDFLLRNDEGQTPLDIALATNHAQDVINILQEGEHWSRIQQQQDLEQEQKNLEAIQPSASATPQPLRVRLVCQHNINTNQTYTSDDDEDKCLYIWPNQNLNLLDQAHNAQQDDDETFPNTILATS